MITRSPREPEKLNATGPRVSGYAACVNLSEFEFYMQGLVAWLFRNS